MHEFDDLIYSGTAFTLNALEDLNSKTKERLEIGASTIDVKSLQMIQLQKAILAIGTFSLFESILQKELSCDNGFEQAKKILAQKKEIALNERFDMFIRAINVLKHGRGRSYESLIKEHETLPFRIKLPDDIFYDEGDVSEVATLIEVDDKFVLNCVETICLVVEVIKDYVAQDVASIK